MVVKKSSREEYTADGYRRVHFTTGHSVFNLRCDIICVRDQRWRLVSNAAIPTIDGRQSYRRSAHGVCLPDHGRGDVD